jgi:hypothetical protein
VQTGAGPKDLYTCEYCQKMVCLSSRVFRPAEGMIRLFSALALGMPLCASGGNKECLHSNEAKSAPQSKSHAYRSACQEPSRAATTRRPINGKRDTVPFWGRSRNCGKPYDRARHSGPSPRIGLPLLGLQLRFLDYVNCSVILSYDANYCHRSNIDLI